MPTPLKSLDNVWVESWAQSGGTFPAIEAATADTTESDGGKAVVVKGSTVLVGYNHHFTVRKGPLIGGVGHVNICGDVDS
jgi:hypothetical protein